MSFHTTPILHNNGVIMVYRFPPTHFLMLSTYTWHRLPLPCFPSSLFFQSSTPFIFIVSFYKQNNYLIFLTWSHWVSFCLKKTKSMCTHVQTHTQTFIYIYILKIILLPHLFIAERNTLTNYCTFGFWGSVKEAKHNNNPPSVL